MKRFLVIAICLLGLAIPQVVESRANSPLAKSVSEDGWTSLGRIDLHLDCHFSKEINFGSDGKIYTNYKTAKKYGTATLLVKEVGNRLYYKIRYKQKGQSNIVSVSVGSWDYFCTSCNTVHSFDGKAGDYYLILP